MTRSVRTTRAIAYTDGSATLLTLPSATTARTQSTEEALIVPKAVTTTEVSVAPSSLGTATLWLCMIINRHATNYIEVGTTSGDYGFRVEAGDTFGPVMLNTSKTLYLKANTTTCNADLYFFAK